MKNTASTTKLKLNQSATRPRIIEPEAEALRELCEHYAAESWIDWADKKIPCWPLNARSGKSKWAINREWLVEVCVEKGFMRKLAGTDYERKQCTEDEVESVVKFLVELKAWCRLNGLELPDDCDPSKWDMLSGEQREAILEGLALNSDWEVASHK